ncbi:MAG: hypothetical protein AAFO68_01655, partial [Pseudomonadota bacterium]
LMWEFRNGNWVKWPLTMPSNKIKPGDPGELQTIETIYRDMSALLTSLFEPQLKQAGEKGDPIAKLIRTELARASETLLGHVASGLWADIKDECDKVREFLLSHISKDLLANDTIRRLYISIDYFLALMRGAIADDVHVKGFDHLDDVNFDAWLAKHGAHPITISSPLALNTPNLSYQYPTAIRARSRKWRRAPICTGRSARSLTWVLSPTCLKWERANPSFTLCMKRFKSGG